MSLPAINFKPEDSMEARVSVLQAHYQHIQAYIQELRDDVKEIRQEMNTRFGEIQKTLEAMNISRVWDRVWMLLSMGALLGVMARGFKWI
ncbi:MAG: hypothetical protein WDO68_02405 [Gammaproteobacteria bacterium]